jgi:2,4-dienoyl-CoA reductase-like NADH-dependent reductase (Old Yellow Enzyme family)
VIAPSAIPFNPTDPAPIVLDQAGIDGIVASFEAAAGRALEAGFKVVEIHAAHGYLLHEFLSPFANFRSDAYGGSLENRMRLPLRVAETVRARVPRGLPVSFPPPTGSRAVGILSNQSSSLVVRRSAASI